MINFIDLFYYLGKCLNILAKSDKELYICWDFKLDLLRNWSNMDAYI